MEGNIYFTRAH